MVSYAMATNQEISDSIATEAESFIDKSYPVDGAESRPDLNGAEFVQACVVAAGIEDFPLMADAQFNYGTAIDRNPVRGDLVFFRGSADSPSPALVAICSGPGEIIHTSKGAPVRKDSYALDGSGELTFVGATSPAKLSLVGNEVAEPDPVLTGTVATSTTVETKPHPTETAQPTSDQAFSAEQASSVPPANSSDFSVSKSDPNATTYVEPSLPLLREGMSGYPVRVLQSILGGNVVVDGVFSADLTSALKGFQEFKKVEASGMTDKATWEELIGRTI